MIFLFEALIKVNNYHDHVMSFLFLIWVADSTWLDFSPFRYGGNNSSESDFTKVNLKFFLTQIHSFRVILNSRQESSEVQKYSAFTWSDGWLTFVKGKQSN